MPHQMFFYLFEFGDVHKRRLQFGALCDETPILVTNGAVGDISDQI